MQPTDTLSHRETDPDADLFARVGTGRFRALGELLLTKSGHDLERLQAGWSPSPDLTVWVGRFHDPASYWNTQFHHGAYLQTTLSRPMVDQFGEHGGALPAHLAGLLFEGRNRIGLGAGYYALAAGAGPEVGSELQPVDLLDPGSGNHRLGFSVRYGYRPDPTASNEIGVFAAFYRLPTTRTGGGDAVLHRIGGYLSWTIRSLRIISEIHHVEDSMTHSVSGPRRTNSFTAGYLQIERRFSSKVTIYARAESSTGIADDPYLQLFPQFIQHRILTGLRYELTSRQAIKLEIDRSRTVQDNYDQLSLQWSAVFP